MMKKTKLLFGYLILMVFMILLTGCNSQNNGDVSVNTAAADKHKIEATQDITGVLIPAQTVDVESKVSGQVTNFNFEVGTNVTKGQTLITLETESLNTQLEQATASLKSAQASLKSSQSQVAQAKTNFDSAQNSYNRNQNLYNQGAISKSDFEDAKSKLDIAKQQYQNALETVKGQSQASIDMAQANVNNINNQIAEATIKSPITGVITNKNINIGEIASPGVALVTVADTSTLKLKGTVSQDAIPLLKVGQAMSMAVDIYPDQAFTGKIDSIGPTAVSTGLYFPLEVSIKNNGNLKAGLSAHATIKMASDEGIIIPISAVIQDNGKSYVFVIKDSVAEKRVVVTGLKNDKEIEIVQGIAVGEDVATSNVNNLFDKMTVNVNDKKQADV